MSICDTVESVVSEQLDSEQSGISELFVCPKKLLFSINFDSAQVQYGVS